MISQNQIKKIYAIARELGLNDAELHDVISGMTGKDSLKLLTFYEAGTVIEKLNKRNHHTPALTEMITDAQRSKIWKLIFELEKYDPLPPKSGDERIKRLTGIANKTFNRPPKSKFFLNRTTKSEAATLIDALNRYVRQAQRRFERTVGDADGAEQKL